MGRPGPGAAGLALALALWTGAGAHGFLERADPRAGSTVSAAPEQVRLWFTEAVEPAFSSAQVLDAAGRAVHQGESRVEPASPALLTVPLGPLPPGIYTVAWRVLSVDSHITQGSFTFRVAPR
jgi:hypothetical protein